MWFQNRRTKWRKKSASEPSSTQASNVGQSGEASENEVEDEEYNKPLDPDSDDDKIRLLLRKHRRAFSVLRLGPHHVWSGLSTDMHAVMLSKSWNKLKLVWNTVLSPWDVDHVVFSQSNTATVKRLYLNTLGLMLIEKIMYWAVL